MRRLVIIGLALLTSRVWTLISMTTTLSQFVRGDALEYLADHGHKYDAIHASPPCQAFVSAMADKKSHQDLLTPTISELQRYDCHIG